MRINHDERLVAPAPALDPFADPVAYLQSLGIEAELIAFLAGVPAAA